MKSHSFAGYSQNHDAGLGKTRAAHFICDRNPICSTGGLTFADQINGTHTWAKLPQVPNRQGQLSKFYNQFSKSNESVW